MYLYIPNNKGRLFIQNQHQRKACCLLLCIWWKGTAIRVKDGSRREGWAGFWGSSAPPGDEFCSLLSSLLPLQQLWLAWPVFKLIQLSGGLFLVQSALELAAAQRALLSCCPGCCWFGEARVSPWLCPHSHPLLQRAHRTVPALLLCLPCRTIFIPLYAIGAMLSQLSGSTLQSTSLLSQDPGKPVGSSCLPLGFLSN